MARVLCLTGLLLVMIVGEAAGQQMDHLRTLVRVMEAARVAAEEAAREAAREAGEGTQGVVRAAEEGAREAGEEVIRSAEEAAREAGEDAAGDAAREGIPTISNQLEAWARIVAETAAEVALEEVGDATNGWNFTDSDGIPVQDVNNLSGAARTGIIVRGVLAPRGLTRYATLQAYGPERVCGPGAQWIDAPPNPSPYGPAAVVREEGDRGLQAFYTRTFAGAVEQAQALCDPNGQNHDWWIATTFPVAGEEPIRRLYSSDSKRVAEFLSSARQRP